MAAQNQHYVPKFILRQFLANEAKEQVEVYDKHDDKIFRTSIKNIMAERRFNEFAFDDDWIVSFEPIACGAEDQVIPAYRSVLERRSLDGSPEEKAALAFLMAFQFMRTKAHRDMWQAIEEETVRFIEAQGGKMQDLQGWEDWEPQTEDGLKHNHLISMQKNIGTFAMIFAEKDFLLAEAAPGRSFYLGDHPVALSNRADGGLHGNIGIGVPGIEIYMPLSPDLMLCAWCPTLLAEVRAGLGDQLKAAQAAALAQVMRGQLTPEAMRAGMAEIVDAQAHLRSLVEAADSGKPVSSADANMDYYNSLQATWAYRHVICRDGALDFAREINREHPHLRKGRRATAG